MAPYQFASAESLGASVYDTSMSLSMFSVAKVLINSGAPGAVAFFVFFAQYLQYICKAAMIIVAVIDNCIEIFDWQLVKHQWKRRTVWLIKSAVFCAVLLFCGIPFTMQGGVNALSFLDASVDRIGFVSGYFLALGFLGTYLWNNVATAEKVMISIWGILATVVCVASRITVFASGGGIFYTYDRKDTTSWNDVALAIATTPFAPIFIMMVVHAVQFILQLRRNGEASFEQTAPYTEVMDEVALWGETDHLRAVERDRDSTC